MKFNVQLTCDNAAFADGNRNSETARILRDLATMVERGLCDIGTAFGKTQYRSLFDVNGNNVGAASFVREDEER